MHPFFSVPSIKQNLLKSISTLSLMASGFGFLLLKGDPFVLPMINHVNNYGMAL